MAKRKPRAIFKDGLPKNLAAAAMDAREWLKVTQGFMKRYYRPTRHDDAEARLARCIAELDKYLPEEEMHD